MAALMHFRQAEEVEAVRHHLYIALGAMSCLEGHLTNAGPMWEHIKAALALLPSRGALG